MEIVSVKDFTDIKSKFNRKEKYRCDIGGIIATTDLKNPDFVLIASSGRIEFLVKELENKKYKFLIKHYDKGESILFVNKKIATLPHWAPYDPNYGAITTYVRDGECFSQEDLMDMHDRGSDDEIYWWLLHEPVEEEFVVKHLKDYAYLTRDYIGYNCYVPENHWCPKPEEKKFIINDFSEDAQSQLNDWLTEYTRKSIDQKTQFVKLEVIDAQHTEVAQGTS